MKFISSFYASGTDIDLGPEKACQQSIHMRKRCSASAPFKFENILN